MYVDVILFVMCKENHSMFTSISHRLCLVLVLPVVCWRAHVLFTLIVCVCILFLHVLLYYEAHSYDISGKLKFQKIGMHNRSGSLKTVKQRHSDQTMVGSSLPPIVCKKAHVLLTLFVFACRQWCPTHIVLGIFLFLFLFFIFVLCGLCCQFLWIVHFLLPLQYSPSFIDFSTLNVR